MLNHEDSPSRIESGKYVAEILQGDNPQPFWYYMIQRKGSNQIVDLMKFGSKRQAIEAAQFVLDRLNRGLVLGPEALTSSPF